MNIFPLLSQKHSFIDLDWYGSDRRALSNPGMLKNISKEIAGFLSNCNAGALSELRTPKLKQEEAETRMERLLLFGALLFKCGDKQSLRAELARTRDPGRR